MSRTGLKFDSWKVKNHSQNTSPHIFLSFSFLFSFFFLAFSKKSESWNPTVAGKVLPTVMWIMRFPLRSFKVIKEFAKEFFFLFIKINSHTFNSFVTYCSIDKAQVTKQHSTPKLSKYMKMSAYVVLWAVHILHWGSQHFLPVVSFCAPHSW